MALTEDQKIAARHKLAAGRVLAYRTMPYYTRVLTAIEVFEREGMGTFGVDAHWRLYYDPAKCLEWTAEEIAAVWLHEVSHLVRNHNQRFAELEGHKDHTIFNQAADASINTDLRQQNVTLPNPEQRVYIESKLSKRWTKNMTAEEMYRCVIEDQGIGKGDEDKKGKVEKDTPSDSNPPSDSESTEPDEAGDNAESSQNSVNSTNEKAENSPENGDADSLPDDIVQSDADEVNADGQDNVEDQNSSSNTSKSNQESAQDGDPAEQSSDSPSSGESDSEENSDTENSDSDSGEGSSQSEDNEQSQGQHQESESDSSSTESTDNGEEPSENGESPEPQSDCGSCTGGEPREYEEPSAEGAVDKYAADFIRQKTAEDIVSYENSNPGSVPGDILREAQYILDPQVDWVPELMSFARRVLGTRLGAEHKTYSRMSRRAGASNVIRPGYKAPDPPQIAAILDTSGSMDENREIAAALGELESLLDRFGRVSHASGMNIINCDAAASVEFVRNLRDYEIRGGGGTDMREGIELAAILKPRMDIIITVTDGGTPWPDDRPPANPQAHYIVLLISSKQGELDFQKQRIPKWFHVIPVLVPDRKRRRRRY